MSGRISRGWAISKQSWQVLKKDPVLLPFPIFSAVAYVLVLVSFICPFFVSADLRTWLDQSLGAPKGSPAHDQAQAALALASLVFYGVCYFVMIFFNTALAACAAMRFRGETPTIGAGLKVAVARLPQIIGWTLLAATVGTVLQIIRERSNLVGKIVVGMIGLGWSVATFLVIPTLAVEGLGPIATLKRSSSLIRTAWGEGLVGNIGLGIVNFLMILPVIFLVFGAAFAAGTSGTLALSLLGLAGLWLIAACVVSTAMKQVFVVGLYFYAAEKVVPAGFAEETFQSAFKTK